ncbi:MAG: hypothetical protein ACTSR0_03940 [Candidatus Asgardarchaeia archaeon]
MRREEYIDTIEVCLDFVIKMFEASAFAVPLFRAFLDISEDELSYRDIHAWIGDLYECKQFLKELSKEKQE